MAVPQLQAPSPVSSAAPRSCQNCGTQFEITNYRRQHHKKYCSKTCRLAAWHKANPAAGPAFRKSYRDRNVEKLRAYAAQYRESHREERNAKERARAAKQRDHHRLRAKARYASGAGKESIRRYNERHPDRAKNHRAIQNAHRRGMVGRYTPAEWAARLEEFLHRCAYCPSPATERDHLLPAASGGTNFIDNIVPACLPCNRAKSKSSLLVFLLRRSNEQGQGFACD